MGVLWLQLRADLRTGWRSTLGVALLVAIAGGAVLGALAAAHRTATAFDRMVAATEAADIMVNPDFGISSQLRFEDIATLPMVARAARYDGTLLLPPTPQSAEEMDQFPSGITSDGVAGYDFGRYNILAGRQPDPAEPHEILIHTDYAGRSGLGPADSLGVRILDPDEIGRLFSIESQAAAEALFADPEFGQVVDLEIVGVGVAPDDLILEAGFQPIEVFLTPAFWERYGQPSAGWWGATVRLVDGADGRQFEEAVQALVPEEPIAFQSRTATTDKVERTVRPYVVALLAFAGVAAVLGLIVIVQAVARRSRLRSQDDRLMQALGRSGLQRFASALALVAVPVLIGAVGAVLIAWSVSSIAPLGAVRNAEPAPGPMFDTLVLGGGAVLFSTIVLLAASLPLWRGTRVRPLTTRPRQGRLVRTLTSATSSASLTTGVRFALDPGGSTGSAENRGVLVGAASAVALASALLTFGSSLDHFVTTPRLFGSDWNVVIDGNLASENDEAVANELAAALEVDPAVEAFSLVSVSEVTIDDERVPTVTFHASPTGVEATLIEGRQPDGPAEIVFGRATADQLGVAPGDRVLVRAPDGSSHDVTVVGLAVLPEVGTYSGSDKTSLGEGAIVDEAGLGAFAQPFDKHFMVARVSGPDPVTHTDGLIPTFENGDWLAASTPSVPAEVTNLARLRATPTLLLGLLVLLVGAAVVHALLVGFRARRHDVAILQAFGYRPRQVVTTSLWQATTIGAIAVAIGLPLGLILGRWAWMLLVGELAAVSAPVTPILGSVALVASVFLLVNLLGLLPGWRASRRRPAETLRAE